jgi:hypothetical protein
MHVNEFFCALQHFFMGVRTRPLFSKNSADLVFSKCYRANALGKGQLSVVGHAQKQLKAGCEQSIDFEATITGLSKASITGEKHGCSGCFEKVCQSPNLRY